MHLIANTVLSVLTIVASFTLAILLYAIMGFRSNTHPLIYVTAGLLLAMGGWHIQTLIRTLKLKKQWKRRAPRLNWELKSEATLYQASPEGIRSRCHRKVVRRGKLCGCGSNQCHGTHHQASGGKTSAKTILTPEHVSRRVKLRFRYLESGHEGLRVMREAEP